MKNIFKKILFVILGLLLLYGIFLTEESIRLEKNNSAKPLIVLKINTNVYAKSSMNFGRLEEEYVSLGFTLKRTNILDTPKDPNSDAISYHIEKSSLSLFNHFTVWQWIV